MGGSCKGGCLEDAKARLGLSQLLHFIVVFWVCLGGGLLGMLGELTRCRIV